MFGALKFDTNDAIFLYIVLLISTNFGKLPLAGIPKTNSCCHGFFFHYQTPYFVLVIKYCNEKMHDREFLEHFFLLKTEQKSKIDQNVKTEILNHIFLLNCN